MTYNTRSDSHNMKLALIVIMLFVGLSGLDKYLMGFAIKIIAEMYGYAPTDLSILLSAFQAGFIISTLVGGFLVDKFGYKKYLIATFSILSIVSFSFGFVSSLSILIALRFFAGIGASGLAVAVPKAIASLYKFGQASKIQAKINPVVGVAGIFTALIGKLLLSGSISLKVAYLCLGVMFLLVTLCVIFIIPNLHPASSAAINFHLLVQAYKNKAVLFLSIIYILFNTVTVALLNWLPTAFAQFEGSSPQLVSLVMFGFYIVETLVLMATGPVVNRWFWEKTSLLLGISIVGAIASLICFSAIHTVGLGIVTIYAATGFLMFASGVLLLLPYRYASGIVIASSFAAVNVGGRIGGLISPFIVTLFVTSSGLVNFSAAFLAYAGVLAISLIFIKALPPVDKGH